MNPSDKHLGEAIAKAHKYIRSTICHVYNNKEKAKMTDKTLDLKEKLKDKRRDEIIEGVLPIIVEHERTAQTERALVYKEVHDCLKKSQDVFTDVLMRFKDDEDMRVMIEASERAFQKYILIHKRVYPRTKEMSTIKYDMIASETLELVQMRHAQLLDYLKDYV